ncbi:MAG TPA: exosome complex RNA-binding protein Csl4 [Candidatus Bathyarchaeia archaeon]|nr:exosome complex RNA-binding protein Csl4 [Candidatus Bathyarchaeia archaeon]
MAKKVDGTFVVPGEKLGVVEEFDPGRGTVDVNGVVFSSQTGTVTVDGKRRVVTVKTVTGPVVVPEEGSSVVGIVEKVQEKMAIINIVMVDGKKMELPFTGMLHISNSSPRFERIMGEVCKPNDILRAKVIDTSQRIPKLTTVGRELGVIKAYCSRCGNELVLSGRILRCSVCRNVERRRLAEDFESEGGAPVEN